MKAFSLNEYKNGQLKAGLQNSDNFAPLPLPMQVPEKYFDSLESEILKKTVEANAMPGFNPALLPQSLPFTVPADYFSRLESEVLKKTSEAIEPALSLKAENIFTVPEGYWDHLLLRIMERIRKPETAWGRALRFLNAPLPKYSFAGGLALSVAVFVYMLAPVSTADNLNDVSDKDIVAYLEQNMNADITDEISAVAAQSPNTKSLSWQSQLKGKLSDKKADIEAELTE
ncbi:MAG: hypothetical protein V4543_04620 [Bacteroidota bacterium]